MVGHGCCPPSGLPECASRTPAGNVACRGDGAGQRAWERCTRQSADLAATTAGRCPPAASDVRARRWTGARPSQRRRCARSARCSRGRSPAPGTFGPARLCVSCPESAACGGRSHPPSGQPRRPVERVGNIGWQFSSPGQPSYPGLSRQTDSTGILEDRAGRTSVTSRSPRRRGDDRPAIGHCGHRAEGQPRLEKAEKGQQPEAAHRRRRHLPARGRKGPCSRSLAATSCAGE